MIEIVIDDELEGDFTPSDQISRAVKSACTVAGYPDFTPDLCIRFAPDDAVALLNSQWRQKQGVTDVLSFPMQSGPEFDFSESIGDVVLAVPFIHYEAERLRLRPEDHTLHLIVHATLHLIGYDHVEDSDAEEMQALESEAMATMGLHDPYPVESVESPERL